MMVIGYDTYHDSSQKGRSAGGFVASSNDAMTRWYSRVNYHSGREEMSTSIAKNVVLALKNWYTLNNNSLPRGIVLYRDGVGEGNIAHVNEVEVKQIQEAIRHAPNCQNIKLTYVIVSKRVNARFFHKKGDDLRSLDNCPPGTVIDSVVTRPQRKDFYLTSQSVREGTLTPTLFDAIVDEANVPINTLQNLTYTLTHLYYNWQV